MVAGSLIVYYMGLVLGESNSIFSSFGFCNRHSDVHSGLLYVLQAGYLNRRHVICFKVDFLKMQP